MSKIKVFFAAFLVFFTVFYFWKSPWSPILEQRIQSKIVADQIDEAIQLLEWRAQYDFNEERRKEDIWQASQLSYIRSNDTDRSRRLLELCLSLPYFSHTTQARIQFGSLTFKENPQEGIIIWEKALEVDADYDGAARLWARIASEYELLMDFDNAIRAWEKASKYPEIAHMSHLALGRLKIKGDPQKALEHFQKVKNDKFMERTRAAELGEKLAQWEIEKEKE